MFGILIFLFLSVISLYEFAAAEEMECKKCHQPVYDEISKFTFKHYDKLLDECKGCHLSVRDAGKKEDKWERVSLTNYGSEHMAVLKDLSIDSTYQTKVNIMDKRGRKKESDPLTFIPASISEFLTDDETPPVIGGVEVNLIDAPVFAGVEIRFKTDEFSNSMIEYGTTKDYGKSINSGFYSKRHIIKLTGIDNKKVYHFGITVTDPFGNRTISENYTFNAVKLSKGRQESEKQKEDDTKLDFQSMRLLRLKPKEGNSKYDIKKAIMEGIVVVYLTASSEVTSVVEYMKKKDENDSEAEKHGKGLKSRREIEINTCMEKCHKRGGSHPVGVTLRRDMTAPDEIPLGKGKIITCVTCHLPHGSKIKYLARIDFEKLCVLCHLDR